MTTNQIAYLNSQENARHNKVTESETERSNRANEAIASKNADWNAAGIVLGSIVGR